MEHIPQALFLLTAAFKILLVFMLISAVMVIVQCEFMVVANVGLILVALGGSKFFKEYAVNIMRYVLSATIKPLGLQLVVGIGPDIFDSINLTDGDLEASSSLIVAITSAVMLLVLA